MTYFAIHRRMLIERFIRAELYSRINREILMKCQKKGSRQSGTHSTVYRN